MAEIEGLGADKDFLSGVLGEDEPHPASISALLYIKSWTQGNLTELAQVQEIFARFSVQGNRQAQVCYDTLHDIMNNEEPEDLYILGLAWTLKQMKDGIGLSKNKKDKNEEAKELPTGRDNSGTLRS